jgi:hypothetical protein
MIERPASLRSDVDSHPTGIGRSCSVSRVATLEARGPRWIAVCSFSLSMSEAELQPNCMIRGGQSENPDRSGPLTWAPVERTAHPAPSSSVNRFPMALSVSFLLPTVQRAFLQRRFDQTLPTRSASPMVESVLTELLATKTPMPVIQVQHEMRIEPDHVYVIPPNTTMMVHDGSLDIRGAARHAGGIPAH